MIRSGGVQGQADIMEEPAVTQVPKILYKCATCPKLFPSVDQALSCCKDTTVIPKLVAVQDDDDRPGRHGGMRNRIWGEADTERLIQLVKQYHHKIKDRKERPYRVWLTITEEMAKTMPDITTKQVDMKWKNIKCQYKSYVNNKITNAKPGIRQPLCYELLKSFLEEPLPKQPSPKKQESNVKHVSHNQFSTIDELDLELTQPELDILGLDYDSPLTKMLNPIKVNMQPERPEKPRRLLSSLFRRSANEPNKEREQPRTEEDSPEVKKKRKEWSDKDTEKVLDGILEETRRHNRALESHNMVLRCVFAKMVASMEKKNTILKEVVEREQS